MTDNQTTNLWGGADPVARTKADPNRSYREDALVEMIERMEEALHRIVRWSEAYPLEAFPELDHAYYAKAAKVLEANGMTLARLSAAAMRHVILRVADIAKEGLNV